MSSAKSAWSRAYQYRHCALPALVKSQVHAFARLQVKEESVTGARERGKGSDGVVGSPEKEVGGRGLPGEGPSRPGAGMLEPVGRGLRLSES